MNTFEIFNEIKKLDCFYGIFPMDKLNRIYKKRPIGIIINLDPSDMPGSHWTALYISSDNIAFYLDSFGLPIIHNELYKFLRNHKVNKIIYNKYELQQMTSESCGAYSILFLKMMCNNFLFKEFLNLFSSNQYKNDLLVSRIIV